MKITILMQKNYLMLPIQGNINTVEVAVLILH